MTDLIRDLFQLFRRGVDSPLSKEAFNAFALRAFEHQFVANRAYGAFARGRQITPEKVEHWEQVPPVPARAFKELSLLSGDPEDVRKTFRTSGTTRGRERRGEHHLLDVDLYEACLLPNFRANLLPDTPSIRILSLIPPPADLPDSSLSHMTGVVMRECGTPGSDYFADGWGTLAAEALASALRGAVRGHEPVLLMGTAFALVHWIDATDGRGERFVLPEGSRIMETGGFKGRSRSVPRGDLYQALGERLDVPGHRIVNEYGMTELLSQFYEPVLRGGDVPDDLAGRWHVPPPWVRTRVLHPTSLAEVAPGEQGLLCHFDLANIHSVCAVLTEDVGIAVEDGFRVLGRSAGAEPRGCSLAMDELLSLARDER